MLRRLFQGRTSKDALSKSENFRNLEKQLVDPCAKPMALPLEFLKFITLNFSSERELGQGGFGVVYKGLLRNGKTIAVKKLKDTHIEYVQFKREVIHLIGLEKHENIVQLRGFCLESKGVDVVQSSNGKNVLVEKQDRLICFEYLNKRSLDKYLSAESSGLEWHIIYQIVKGICCGLHYLHKKCNIVHLDLKPQNILMDDNMVPKIADFGMSRLFSEQQTGIITKSCEGTLGYMAPEYLEKGLISTKSDIFSFGVIIIELLIGSRDYPENSEAPFGHFIEKVAEKWRSRYEKKSKYELEIYSQQVKACTVVGLRCVDSDHKKRPAAWQIIEMLEATESEVLPPQMVASWSSLTSNVEVKVPSLVPSSSEYIRFSYGIACSTGERASMDCLYDVRIDDVDGEKVGMFGVYAGYGVGLGAAEYVKQHLFSNLIKHPKFITDIKAAIAEAYGHTDTEFLKADSSETRDAGSTALTATIAGDRLLVANVGDCRAVMCKGGQAIAVSRDHKPDQADERQRIEDAGGFIMWNHGWRVNGILDISRAFGYKSLKQYVVADPEIKEEVVDNSLQFLILANVGLWDVVSNEEAVAMVRPIQDPQEAANKLLEEAFRRGSSRSITIVIVHFLDETTGDKLG